MILQVTESSQVGTARRAAHELSERAGFDPSRSGAVALIVSEMATNLSKYATAGEIQLRVDPGLDCVAIEALAIDRGPGMYDLEECMRDGFSTSGTSGTGLGAIQRLSSDFDAYSQPGSGTVILSRINRNGNPKQHPFDSGVIQAPFPGELNCGDAWTVVHRPNFTRVMIADGLGHGDPAHQASERAREVVEDTADLDPVEAMERIHGALRPTRGAAVAIADIVHADRQLRFVGVGNINAAVFSGGRARHTVSHNGTAGHSVRKIQEFQYDFPHDSTLIMHSDGLTSRWTLDAYPGLLDRRASIIAAVLYRDFRRLRDDATVLALREVR